MRRWRQAGRGIPVADNAPARGLRSKIEYAISALPNRGIFFGRRANLDGTWMCQISTETSLTACTETIFSGKETYRNRTSQRLVCRPQPGLSPAYYPHSPVSDPFPRPGLWRPAIAVQPAVRSKARIGSGNETRPGRRKPVMTRSEVGNVQSEDFRKW